MAKLLSFLLLTQSAVISYGFIGKTCYPTKSGGERHAATTLRMRMASAGVASDVLTSKNGSPLKSSRAAYLQKLAALTLGGVSLVGKSGSASAVPAAEGPDLNSILVQKAGKSVRFGDAKGKKATVVVNVASQCALTGGLQELYEKYHDQGLEILAFPSNQKFLINADGTPVRRYQPGVDPEEMEADILSVLQGKKLPSARKKSLNEY
ncbi:hypothetical protein NSK_002437 [Nannochloropsis salina CCMP1776]|uniref:Glutathione peroxidase n=1 Tax=Nannochloropsis salina CCMP1776 TaxID=1027361 RepID=A0A4D9DCG6_9STRA|nr:hypothetical protein NSK_002437 [Nannochloropsis salina CCMP1776]|eukprot:TFJ86229.1 hypothetical protein NSK_002437 [Nannochloropsis salina CCMP1776]